MDSQVTPPNRVTSPAWGAPLMFNFQDLFRKCYLQDPLKVIKVICDRLIHGFDYYWTCIRQCEIARKISCPFRDLSVFSVFITWAYTWMTWIVKNYQRA